MADDFYNFINLISLFLQRPPFQLYCKMDCLQVPYDMSRLKLSPCILALSADKALILI